MNTRKLYVWSIHFSFCLFFHSYFFCTRGSDFSFSFTFLIQVKYYTTEGLFSWKSVENLVIKEKGSKVKKNVLLILLMSQQRTNDVKWHCRSSNTRAIPRYFTSRTLNVVRIHENKKWWKKDKKKENFENFVTCLLSMKLNLFPSVDWCEWKKSDLTFLFKMVNLHKLTDWSSLLPVANQFICKYNHCHNKKTGYSSSFISNAYWVTDRMNSP